MNTLHICCARGVYIGQVRIFGGRRWRTVTGKCKSPERALSSAILKMSRNDKSARALFVDSSLYYEPIVSMEARR